MNNPIYVGAEDSQLFQIEYFDNGSATLRAALESQWKRFWRDDPISGKRFQILYRPTNRNMEVVVDRLMPASAPPGRYRVEVFIPGRHATTRKAIFTVANQFRKEGDQTVNDDTMAIVDMFDLFDVWHTLGEFVLEPGKHPLSGRVRQYDLSLEDPPVEAAYGPVRWLPISAPLIITPTPMPGAVRFDSPVGTEAERFGPFASGAVAFGKFPVWAGEWFDINPYLSWYSYGYHTGADLNLPGSSEADRGKPIYAVGDGVVTYAGDAGSWGNIVVVEHPDALATLPDGRVQRQRVYSRYGHVDANIQIKKGQVVRRGQLVAFVGLPAGQVSGWHLHFDICYTDLLKSKPAHWPDMSTIRSLQKAEVSINSAQFRNAQAAVKREVVSHYLDPLRFVMDNHR